MVPGSDGMVLTMRNLDHQKALGRNNLEVTRNLVSQIFLLGKMGYPHQNLYFLLQKWHLRFLFD